MTLELLTTGSELLLGEVVNTHASWFGRELFGLGMRLSRQTSVPDGEAIREALAEAMSRSDIIFVTGGLGPTSDDVTREVAADLLGLKLVEHKETLDRIRARLHARGIVYRERMGRQAMVPETAVVLPNNYGTAPGLYIPAAPASGHSRPHLFLLPGPPRELKPIFEEHVRPILARLVTDRPPECRTYRVVGIGESEVEERIGLELSKDGRFEIGYCARPNEVDFRVIGQSADIDDVEPRILAAVGERLFSQDGRSLESVVVSQYAERGLVLTAAESCTGGLLLHRITNVPGASAVLRLGYVTYANECKTSALGVPADLLSSHGAVSAEVAMAMAEGARARAGADVAVSLTGIAGPDGGTPAKPVGLVFIGLAIRNASPSAREFRFPTDRETFKQLATQAALDMLRGALREIP